MHISDSTSFESMSVKTITTITTTNTNTSTNTTITTTSTHIWPHVLGSKACGQSVVEIYTCVVDILADCVRSRTL